MEAQIVVLKSEFQEEESEAIKLIEMEKAYTKKFADDKRNMAKSRKADKLIKKTLIM